VSWSAITEIIEVIGRANVGLMTDAVGVDTLAAVVMEFRWNVLLRSLGSRASLWEAFLAYSAGVCVCNVTPARTLGGDVCRAALIPRHGGTPSAKAIGASVVYDRAADIPGFLMLGLLAVPTLKVKLPHWSLLASIALTVALVMRPLYRRLVVRIDKWHQAIVGGEIRTSVVAKAVGCSLLIWSLDIARIMLVGRAFGVLLGASQAATVSLLRLASGMVPVPAGIGVVDGALIAGFLWLGLPPPVAGALAIAERAIVLVWATAMGAFSLLLLGGSRALRRVFAGKKAGSDSTADDSP
jgi:uncharacterized membrane protein YbhN (UPF0104 family)